jgi:hypothetical protein
LIDATAAHRSGRVNGANEAAGRAGAPSAVRVTGPPPSALGGRLRGAAARVGDVVGPADHEAGTVTAGAVSLSRCAREAWFGLRTGILLS